MATRKDHNKDLSEMINSYNELPIGELGDEDQIGELEDQEQELGDEDQIRRSN